MNSRRFFHYHPTIHERDAIGFSLTFLHNLLLKAGYESYLVNSGRRSTSPSSLIGAVTIDINQVLDIAKKDDVVICHYSFFDPMIERMSVGMFKKVLVYHNITPGIFFHNVGMTNLGNACDAGRHNLSRFAAMFDVHVADSAYNAQEIEQLGLQDVRVVPVFIDLDTFSTSEYDAIFLDKVKSSAEVNLLFVGRFVPNKRIDALIDIVKVYAERFRPNIKLHIVGKIWDSNYYLDLLKKAAQLDVFENIVVYIDAPSVTLKTLFMAADAFVSMSEHEGFMVPLIEAFSMGCPVIALRSSAVTETLGGQGMLLDNLNAELAAAYIEILRRDLQVRKKVIAGQASRLSDFQFEMTAEKWAAILGVKLEGRDSL